MKKFLTALAATLLVANGAMAAGYFTNGVPQINPGGTFYAPNGTLNSAGQSNYTYSNQLGGYELVPVEAPITFGGGPVTYAASAFQIGALAAVVGGNTATASSGAATLNTTYGVVTSEAITTAAGSTYTLTLTNSTIAANSDVQVAAYLGAGTAGALQIASVTPAAGSAVIVVKNVGSAALNAAIKIVFQVK